MDMDLRKFLWFIDDVNKLCFRLLCMMIQELSAMNRGKTFSTGRAL